jgi:hypothetical protein
MGMRKDYTTLWLVLAALGIAFWATTVDQGVDLNNHRCLEAVGGTDQC